MNHARMLGVLVLLLLTTITGAWAQAPTIDTAPKFTGYVRGWHQTDFSTNQGQFMVKNMMFGVSGNVNEAAGYKFLVDLSRIGKLTTTTLKDTVSRQTFLNGASASFTDIMLDAQATLRPFDNVAFSIGQFKIPFSTENLRPTETLDFVNTALTANVAPASRDIGAMVSYKIKGSVPVDLYVGLFNGSGTNKAETDQSSDYVARAVVRPLKELAISGNYYAGNGLKDLSVFDFGAEYTLDALFLNAEYVQKGDKTSGATVTSNAMLGYATYVIPLEGMMVQSVIPTVRYELYDANTGISSNEVGRLTFGASLQFAKINYAQFRINYELYDYKDGVTKNPDKLIFEVQTKF